MPRSLTALVILAIAAWPAWTADAPPPSAARTAVSEPEPIHAILSNGISLLGSNGGLGGSNNTSGPVDPTQSPEALGDIGGQGTGDIVGSLSTGAALFGMEGGTGSWLAMGALDQGSPAGGISIPGGTGPARSGGGGGRDVPEPSALAIMAGALIALRGLRRQR